MPKLVSKSFKTPKGCHVRYVELQPKGALVGYDCGGMGRGGLDFDTPDGGRSNYPSSLVKGVRAVNTPGTRVAGYGSRVGFVMGSRHVTCNKRASDDELHCFLHTDDGVISGARKRRRR